MPKRKLQLPGRIARLRPGITKRQKFVIGVLFLSLTLFVTENLFSHAGLYTALILSLLSDLFLFWGLGDDLKENFFLQLFILPFFFSLSFGLFYFLVPARYITRIAMTMLYGLGLYSLFLSENIFTVSSIRTIALLSGARTVSFIITLISYFFLLDVLFSFHLPIWFALLLFVACTFPILLQSIWTYSLQKKLTSDILWVSTITLCMCEVFVVLWFWPSTPTVVALFLAGIFYTLVGLSHAWLEKRLFKSIIWEYIWVAAIIFVGLFLFTSWTS